MILSSSDNDYHYGLCLPSALGLLVSVSVAIYDYHYVLSKSNAMVISMSF